MNIPKCEDRVRKLLIRKPALRDDPTALILSFWWLEVGGSEDMSGLVLFRTIINNNHTKAESITRCSRKLQELYPELRGEKYLERQRHQETVKAQLAEMEDMANSIKLK